MPSLSPILFAQQAEQFLEAARREFRLAGSDVSVPGYFLVSRALELVLKSFMLLKHDNDRQLRKVGHDLERGLAEARLLGLDEVMSISSEYESAVHRVNRYYHSKDLEYLTTGRKSYPPATYLLDCTGQILEAMQLSLRGWRAKP